MKGLIKGIGTFLHNLFEEYKFVRRAALAWACWLITVVVLRATQPDVLLGMTASGVSIVTAVIGILATVVGFYQHSRNKEDKNG